MIALDLRAEEVKTQTERTYPDYWMYPILMPLIGARMNIIVTAVGAVGSMGTKP